LIYALLGIFVINALLNSSWIFAWHYDLIWLPVLIMIGLLITLILIAEILRRKDLNQKEIFLIRLPFNLI